MATARHGKEKVKKDTLDLRDIYYEPTLAELPDFLDNEAGVPLIRDQESEGACVGFAAAAVANFLLANQSKRRGRRPVSVSPRMFYEMAKRYDEWEGEDYEGSSLRGAMKGWFHHGICTEALWSYDPEDSGRFTPDVAADALRRPLGAYYRVRHRHLNHMHSALNETGILLASASVHQGWDDVGANGSIPYRRGSIGGHAFAIMGYDELGFWIQNSWGDGWGYRGFGHLLYEDWLENGWDCWVARMGVPVQAFGSGRTSVAARAQFDFVPRGEAGAGDIAPHLVHLGDDGRLKETGRFATDAKRVHDLVHTTMPARSDTWAKRRIVLYAHGGLNDAGDSATRIASMREVWLANEIYPIHFMWETGLVASAIGAARHALSLDRAAGVGERFTDLLDEAIELGARPLGKPVWSEMKQNARLASGDHGGAALLVDELRSWFDSGRNAEIHLVGHSAGSIFHAHLVERLVAAGIPIESLVLLAPACTTALFRETVVPHARRIGRVAIFNLTERAERDDSVGPYRKSLLYLVSESFEPRRHEAILGLDKALKDDPPLRRFMGAGKETGLTTRGYLRGMPPPAAFRSDSASHGDFDNDDATLNATLRVILRRVPGRNF